MLNIEILRAIVRPFCIMFSVVWVGILAMMFATGYSMPATGVGADCVHALLGIAGIVTAEYAAERGVKQVIQLFKKK